MGRRNIVKGITVMANFYRFDQNNSGGDYQKPARHVFVEANTSEEANNIAEKIGIYFDGADMGYDCDCCGDRWNPVYHFESKSISDVNAFINKYGDHDTRAIFAVVYFLNGTVARTKY
jgi:hypothetical protein